MQVRDLLTTERRQETTPKGDYLKNKGSYMKS
jgi:hypothetical protein